MLITKLRNGEVPGEEDRKRSPTPESYMQLRW